MMMMMMMMMMMLPAPSGPGKLPFPGGRRLPVCQHPDKEGPGRPRGPWGPRLVHLQACALGLWLRAPRGRHGGPGPRGQPQPRGRHAPRRRDHLVPGREGCAHVLQLSASCQSGRDNCVRAGLPAALRLCPSEVMGPLSPHDL